MNLIQRELYNINYFLLAKASQSIYLLEPWFLLSYIFGLYFFSVLSFKKQYNLLMRNIKLQTYRVITYWIFIFYVFQFLFLNVTHLYRFFNIFKARFCYVLLALANYFTSLVRFKNNTNIGNVYFWIERWNDFKEANKNNSLLGFCFLITVNLRKAFIGPILLANANNKCAANSRSFGTAQQVNSDKENPPKEKKASSWRLWFTLRLIVFFGLLIFLFFSYLLSESFDFEKVYKQISILLNDPHKLQNFIWRCWTKYINIWDFRQWVVSVGAIIPGYWYLFNVLYSIGILDKKFTPSQKIFFIATDLFLNFVVGLVYMAYPRTVIGALMCQCPVALSPYFIIIEIIVFILYKTWLKYKAKDKS